VCLMKLLERGSLRSISAGSCTMKNSFTVAVCVGMEEPEDRLRQQEAIECVFAPQRREPYRPRHVGGPVREPRIRPLKILQGRGCDGAARCPLFRSGSKSCHSLSRFTRRCCFLHRSEASTVQSGVQASLAEGAVPVARPNIFQSAYAAVNLSVLTTVTAITPAQVGILAGGTTVLRDHAPRIIQSDNRNIVKTSDVSIERSSWQIKKRRFLARWRP
jgi:hypothetical protein